MQLYQLDDLYEQVAFIAYYFHWSKQEIEQLPHMERERYIRQISYIHKQESGKKSIFDL